MLRAGYRFRCLWCSEGYSVCSSCYCGQRYCSKACSGLARLKTCRDAQRRYVATQEGRENRRKLQKQYRIRKSRNLIKKRVTDQSSNLNGAEVGKQDGNTKLICFRCRKRIFSFVKRFGGSNASPRDSI